MKLFILTVSVCVLSFPVYSYIDPGSGSAIMSAIIGFFVAIGIAIKTYWYKIKGIFKSSKDRSKK